VPVGEFPISACDDVDVLDVSEDRSSLDPDQAKCVCVCACVRACHCVVHVCALVGM
jgi:hypothetical protein